MKGAPGTRRRRFCKACGKDITYEGERGPRGGYLGTAKLYCDEHPYANGTDKHGNTKSD